MKKILTVLVIIFFFFGIQTILLGALYKIQSWEMPTIGDLTVNLLAVGLVMSGIALTLMILKNNWSVIAPEDRLELDEHRLRQAEKIELPGNEDDLLV